MEGWQHSVKASTLQILGPWFLLDWVSNIFVVVVFFFNGVLLAFNAHILSRVKQFLPDILGLSFRIFGRDFKAQFGKTYIFHNPHCQ